jgi:hypothetical protein
MTMPLKKKDFCYDLTVLTGVHKVDDKIDFIYSESARRIDALNAAFKRSTQGHDTGIYLVDASVA